MPNIIPALQALAVPIASLHPDPANARKHNDKNLDAIKASLAKFGQRKPVVVQREGMIVRAGNGTLAAAKALGWTEVAAVVLDDDNATASQFAIADNRTAELAEWDNETLATLLDGMDEQDRELLGFDADDMKQLIGELTPEIVEDEVPEPPADPVTKPGDVWLLGKHRLMCGDSTDVLAVETLTAGGKIDMLYCDPPYGMALDTDYSKIKGSAKSPNAKGYKWEKVIGDDVDFDPAPLIELFAETKEQFWWGADYFFECLPRGGSLLVWQKRDKADAEMIGNDFEICWSKQRHKKATFWKRWVGFDSVERGEKRVHPTQKPIDLHCWVFDQWGKASDTVLDLFGGSGSTLIACEKTGRQARLMELDPRYCDVIVKRWETLTGKKAVLADG